MRRVTVILACLSLLLLPLLSRADGGDLVRPGFRGVAIPGQYIVMLKDGADVSALADKLSKKHFGQVQNVYDNVLRGFSLRMSDLEAGKLAKEEGVVGVFQDREVSIMAQSQPQLLPTGVDRINAENKSNKGAGMEVAVLDTGVDKNHVDLKANILGGYNCVPNFIFTNTSAYDDGNGHGTWVAGAIAGIDNTVGTVGAAPQSKIWAVRVLDAQGNGSWSSVICGINWVTNKAKSDPNLRVASMSLGGGGTSGPCNADPLHQAICNSVAAGVTYVVAAGNSGGDLKNFVPAAYPEVIAVSALADKDGKACGVGAATSYGADDTFASFSNYATQPADLARLIGAPGVSINGLWKNGGYSTISGTSMATPYVSAAAALFIKTHPGSTPAQVLAGLLAVAENANVNVNGECAGSALSHSASSLHPEPILRTDAL